MSLRDCVKCVEYDLKWGCAYGLSPDDSRCVYEEMTFRMWVRKEKRSAYRQLRRWGYNREDAQKIVKAMFA
jgi:hypothetical protein